MIILHDDSKKKEEILATVTIKKQQLLEKLEELKVFRFEVLNDIDGTNEEQNETLK